MIKNILKKILIILSITVNLYSLESISQKLSKINYTQDEINKIQQELFVLENNNIPESMIVKLINEATIKKPSFDKFYLFIKNFTNKAILAKNLINKVKTNKFYPKDYEYCLSTTIDLLNSGVTEEEYIKLITLLSNNYSFDDATAMLNYYLVLRRYFPSTIEVSENNKIFAPYDILFVKYYNRSIKDMNLIIQQIVKYFSIDKDAYTIYNFLYTNSHLSTNRILKGLKLLYEKKLKQEVKQEVEEDRIKLQQRNFY